MHELSIATSLVKQLEEMLAKEKGRKLVAITLEMGELSGIEKDAFEFALPFVMENCSFPEAKIIINEVKTELYCNICKKHSIPENKFFMICSHCKSNDVSISKGKDFIIKSVEIED